MGLHGELDLPGDKSIGHRALMFSALCQGTSRIANLPQNNDVKATRACLENLGIRTETADNGDLLVHGQGAFLEPSGTLDAQNSGTTIRLMAGLLAGQNIHTELTGDDALKKRPMDRIILPLQQMGANIHGQDGDRFAPLVIQPAQEGLRGINYTLPIASAQVKSCLILAGLFAQGVTRIAEPVPTRDHTERMLGFLKLPVKREGSLITVIGGQPMNAAPVTWQVPGDISSAAFFLVAASLIPNSDIILRQVGLNPYRTGIINALKKIGADITVENATEACGEPVGDLRVKSAQLSGDLSLSAEDIPAMIDEIPILAVAGVFLNGTLKVRGAEELRHKESDRIAAVVQEFAKLGLEVEDFEDGFRIIGNPRRQLTPPSQALDAHHDHRIAMALAILNNIANGDDVPPNDWPLIGREWAAVSFPGFYDALKKLKTQGTRYGSQPIR